MEFSGNLPLEMTNGRPLCPKCKAPMWSVRFEPAKTTDDKRTFSGCLLCPRKRTFAVTRVMSANAKSGHDGHEERPPFKQSFDDLIDNGHHAGRDRQFERLCRFAIEHKFEFCRLK